MASLVKVDAAQQRQRPGPPSGPIATAAQAHQARLAAGLHGVLHLISAKEWDIVKLTEGVKFKGLGYQVSQWLLLAVVCSCSSAPALHSVSQRWRCGLPRLLPTWRVQVTPVTCETYDGQKVEALTLVAAPASAGDPATFLPSARYMGLIREGERWG